MRIRFEGTVPAPMRVQDLNPGEAGISSSGSIYLKLSLNGLLLMHEGSQQIEFRQTGTTLDTVEVTRLPAGSRITFIF